jgi:O-methyltransferase
MRKVIFFGAGDGGRSASYLINNEYEIIAFADNDSSKQGETFLGKPIISPGAINEFPYDYIVISNIHGDAVFRQLTEQLGVDRDKILDLFMNNIFDTRIATLRLAADEIHENKIRGSVAELGVFQGAFAQYINEAFPDRKLYLFDTFEGFDQRDIMAEKKGGYSNAEIGEYLNKDIELVLKKMKYKDNCIVKKGYFPESASDVNEEFAFVSIDVDLYKPIYDGLDYFYSRLVPGGYIFLHDYNSTAFRGVKEAVREFAKTNPIKLLPMADLGGSLVLTK